MLDKNSLAIINLWSKSTSITRKIDANLGAIHGISFTEYIVLSNLMNAPNHTLRRIDLAEAIGRSASAITKMLLPMEKIGLVSKQANPRDARVSLVKITPAGMTAFEQATVTLNDKSKTVLKTLKSSDVDKLIVILSLLDRV